MATEADIQRAYNAEQDYRELANVNAIKALFGDTSVDYTKTPQFTPAQSTLLEQADARTLFQEAVASGALSPDAMQYLGGFRSPEAWYDSSSNQLDFITAIDRAAGRETPGSSIDYFNTLVGRSGAQDPLADIGYDPNALATQAATNKALRTGQIDDVYNDLTEYYTGERGKQKDKAYGDLKTTMVRRGLTGSGIEENLMSQLNKLDIEGAATLEGRANTAKEGLRTADTELMSSLVDMVQSGGDVGAATQSAGAHMASSLSGAKDAARAQDLSGLFDTLNQLYGQQQYVQGVQSGKKYGSENTGIVTPGSRTSGYSGTIIGS